MSVESDIRQAMVDRIKSVGAVAADDIKWPGVDFTKPTDRRWLEVTIFKNTNGQDTWGDETYRQGILQIAVVDPLLEGEVPMLAILSQYQDAFIKGTVLTSGNETVKFERVPSITSLLDSPYGNVLPLSIPYRSSQY